MAKKSNENEAVEDNDIEVCEKCGSKLVSEEGEDICPKCDTQIDFFGDDDE